MDFESKARPTAGAGAIPPVVSVKNGPCVECKHWIDNVCVIHKKPTEDLTCDNLRE